MPGSPAAGVSGAQSPNESELVIPDTDSGQRAGGQGRGTPAGQAAQPATPGVSLWDFVRMFIILAAVVGAIYLLFWVLRRSAGKRVTENDLIRVLGSKNLAGNRALHLVEVGSSVFLVGASEGGVELISQITDKESLDSVRLKATEEAPGEGATSSSSFRRSFARLRARFPWVTGSGSCAASGTS